MTIAEKAKLLLGITSEDYDDLLDVLVELAEEDAVDFCHLDEYDDGLDTVVVKMVIQLYNRLGNEGISSLSFSGVSESYITDYSEDIIRQLQRHRRLVCV